MVMATPGLAEGVRYDVGDADYDGYFAAAPEEPRGLVVIVHDWDGLTDYEMRRADMLAELGYDAFAIDVFGAGNRPETVEARRAATQEAFSDRDRLIEIVTGGLAAARDASSAETAVVTGYCFGGGVALAAARSGSLEDVAGYSTFHGSFPDGPDWPQSTPPIQVKHGGADESVTLDDLNSFIEDAEAADLTYEIEIYSGAPHAFTDFGSDRYRERADELSWQAFQAFLDRRLGSVG
jgi:dienelactone hydrolase